MRRQIAVRLPEDLVDFVDEQVVAGRGSSRAAVVARALERERRRVLDERDIVKLIEHGDDEDMLALAQWSAQQARPELD